MIQDSKKRRKLVVAALIFIPVLVVSGVYAVTTTITINGDAPISLGAGYTTATTCDGAVTVAANQTYEDPAFKVNAITVSNISQDALHCAGKTLTVVLVADGTTNTATFVIPEAAADTNIFQFDYAQSGSCDGATCYGSTTFTPFALSTFSKVAIAIS